ncbi:nonsense-mediated mRNA decay protein [Colletotrichum higginsianum]|nr:nonsense-mediated mRNA decay protein [Colletotrichum higginsianum]
MDQPRDVLLRAAVVDPVNGRQPAFQSTPSLINANNIGRCDGESLSFVVRPHFLHHMYSYIEIEVHQHGVGLNDTRVGTMTVHLNHATTFRAEFLGVNQTAMDVRDYFHSQASPFIPSIKITLGAEDLFFDVNDLTLATLGNASAAALADLLKLQKVIRGADEGRPALLEWYATKQSNDNVDALRTRFVRHQNLDQALVIPQWSLDLWYEDTDEPQVIQFVDFCRLHRDVDLRALIWPPQHEVITRFVDVSHYQVVHGVGAVYEHQDLVNVFTVLSRVAHAAVAFNNGRTSETFLLRLTAAADQLEFLPAINEECSVLLRGTPLEISLPVIRTSDDPLWWPAKRCNAPRGHLPQPADAIYFIVTIPSAFRGKSNLLGAPRGANLRACVRKNFDKKVLKAEIAALALLVDQKENSASPSGEGQDNFLYLLDFVPLEEEREVNLLKELPGLGKAAGEPRHRNDWPMLLAASVDQLDERQQQFIQALGHISPNIAFLPGPARSGKTTLILVILAASILGVPGGHCPALCIAHNETEALSLANKINSFFSSLRVNNAPKVLYVSAKDCNIPSSSEVSGNLSPAQTCSQVQIDSVTFWLEPLDKIAGFITEFQNQAFYDALHSQGSSANNSNTDNGRPDPIFVATTEQLAVAHVLAHQEEYNDIIIPVTRLLQGNTMSRNAALQLANRVRMLYQKILKDFKGIVCSTPATAGQAPATSFKPSLVVFDNAERIRELSTTALLVHYNPLAWLFFGGTDEGQINVPPRADLGQNPFTAQLRLSLFERAIRAGVNIGRLDAPPDTADDSDDLGFNWWNMPPAY